MASVPNMRLTALPRSGDAAASADGPEGDIFGRLLGATAALESAPGLTVPGQPATGEARLPEDPESEESERDATAVDLALPSQAVDFLPLIEAQAAAPVIVSPAAPAVTEAKAPAPGASAEAPARPGVAAPASPLAAALDGSGLDPSAAVKTAPAPSLGMNSTMAEAEAEADPEAERSPSPAQLPRTDAEPTAKRPRLPALTTPEATAFERPGMSPARAGSTRSAVAAEASAISTADTSPVQAASVQSASPIASLSAMSEGSLARIAQTGDSGRAETPPEPIAAHDLDLAQEGEWLDQLARDIARSREGDGPMRFRLHPQSLGHLRVEVTQTDQGTSIRLTAETEAARSILADAQPRLLTEARAQGVRIAETHVDLAGSGEHTADPRRQGGGRQDEMIRTAPGSADDGSSPAGDPPVRAERYA